LFSLVVFVIQLPGADTLILGFIYSHCAKREPGILFLAGAAPERSSRAPLFISAGTLRRLGKFSARRLNRNVFIRSLRICEMQAKFFDLL
jgi:hypothetical protein